MRKLLIATQNKGKFDEFFGILKDLPFEFLTLDNFNQNIQNLKVEESGKTFAQNATIKAKAYGKKSGLLTLADDSGLCVEALGRRPGIASHRYLDGTDEDRYQKLLKEMKDVPAEKRLAKFVSVVALFDPVSGKVEIAEGECKGRIALTPKGTHGFGFDPVFIVDGLGKHFAELSLEEKNKVSHRAKALEKMKKILVNSCQ
jgi:XTP/dITP diphosphohydrolase